MKRYPLMPNQVYHRFLIWDVKANRIKDQIIMPLDVHPPAADENEDIRYCDTVRTDAAGELIEEGVKLRRD